MAEKDLNDAKHSSLFCQSFSFGEKKNLKQCLQIADIQHKQKAKRNASLSSENFSSSRYTLHKSENCGKLERSRTWKNIFFASNFTHSTDAPKLLPSFNKLFSKPDILNLSKRPKLNFLLQKS
jgi:hypothetical protein